MQPPQQEGGGPDATPHGGGPARASRLPRSRPKRPPRVAGRPSRRCSRGARGRGSGGAFGRGWRCEHIPRRAMRPLDHYPLAAVFDRPMRPYLIAPINKGVPSAGARGDAFGGAAPAERRLRAPRGDVLGAAEVRCCFRSRARPSAAARPGPSRGAGASVKGPEALARRNGHGPRRACGRRAARAAVRIVVKILWPTDCGQNIMANG